MNIVAQCCGLILMAFLLYLSVHSKQVGIYTEKVFLKTILITMASVLLDILSIVAIVHRTAIPEWLLEITCKTYVASVVWVGYLGLVYVLTDLYSERVYHMVEKKYTVATMLSSVVVFCLPIYYYHEGNVVYTYGGSVLATYIFAVLFVAYTIYHLIRYRNKMNKKRRNAVVLWMSVWIVAALTQFLYNHLLLVGYACSIGMLILFFMLENPDANRDRQIGCFNSNALMAYMKQAFEREQSFSIMLISFVQYQNTNTDNEKITATIRKLYGYLKNMRVEMVFKDVEAQLMLLFDSREELEKSLADIRNCMQQGWGRKKEELDLQPSIFVMPDSKLAKNESEILRILKYNVLQEEQLSDDRIVYLDAHIVETIRKKDQIKELIKDAIKNDRMEVFYQPIYSGKQQIFASAEALVRIRKEDGTIVSPGVFIEVAEEYGLIGEIGEIVFDKTCKFMKEEHLEQYGVSYIEVNLSALQCDHYELADIYIDIMNKYQLSPSRINLEITETASIRTKKILLENMKKLIEKGVTFSLDDFGNGQSNLNYVIDMPFHILKLDMAMTRQYFSNPKAKMVVKAATNMVHEMGLKIVAEGIETGAQLKEMMDLGVDYIQGYYFAKPMSQPEYLDFLKDNKGRKIIV